MPAAPFPPRAPESLGRLLAEELLSRREYMRYEVGEVRALHYAEACAALGALRLAGALGEGDLVARLKERYDLEPSPVEGPGKIVNTANHVDANVYGILPLQLYIQTGDGVCLERGLRLADGQWDDPLPTGMTRQTRYWIDDVYMIACLQAQAFRATGSIVYLERAALEVADYLEKLQQPNGLFRHGPEAPFYWGRGNGWVASGLAELLAVLPESEPRYPAIVAGFRLMMSALLGRQAEDGMWRQLVDREDSWKETSATAMFAYAMRVGILSGILPAGEYSPACDRAWDALVGRIEPDGRLREICAGTGQSRDAEYYLGRPRVTGDLHGQAAMLWLCGAMSPFPARATSPRPSSPRSPPA
jgi:unsaturated rhamnogalacturonyl hydrolase